MDLHWSGQEAMDISFGGRAVPNSGWGMAFSTWGGGGEELTFDRKSWNPGLGGIA